MNDIEDEDDDDNGRVVVERMSGLDAWEFYRAIDEETDEAVCKLALRFDDRVDEVEYAVWRREEEPSATGSIGSARGTWDDKERETVLREILTTYASEIPEVKHGVEFDIAPSDEDDEDDFGDEDDDDDE